jgi:hypothetical protein
MALRGVAAGAALALAATAGCYKKTVSASGFGADKMTIERSEGDDRVLGYPKSRYKELPTTK